MTRGGKIVVFLTDGKRVSHLKSHFLWTKQKLRLSLSILPVWDDFMSSAFPSTFLMMERRDVRLMFSLLFFQNSSLELVREQFSLLLSLRVHRCWWRLILKIVVPLSPQRNSFKPSLTPHLTKRFKVSLCTLCMCNMIKSLSHTNWLADTLKFEGLNYILPERMKGFRLSHTEKRMERRENSLTWKWNIISPSHFVDDKWIDIWLKYVCVCMSVKRVRFHLDGQ